MELNDAYKSADCLHCACVKFQMFVSCFVQAHKLKDKIHNVDLNSLTNEEVNEVMHFCSHYKVSVFSNS
jgi:hypothetical protein